MTLSAPSKPAIVLDTNVVLDWLVFRDPSCKTLGAAVEQGQVRWLAAAGMFDEFNAVLGRGVGASHEPDHVAIDFAWRRFAVMFDPPAASAAASASRRCRCTDPDDQPFIDLALQSGARWLLSRDRAVLQLAREARPLGLMILDPSRWSLLAASQ